MSGDGVSTNGPERSSGRGDMHDGAGRPGDRRAGARALPVIADARWFDPVDGAFVLRVECPLTFDEMVAALYGVVEEGDIDGDDELCGSAAVTLLVGGLSALNERAARIRRDEQRGAIEAPAFLALCRRRVAALGDR